MKVPLLDLKAQYQTIRKEIRTSLEEVLESQHFILGPKVARALRKQWLPILAVKNTLALPVYPELNYEQQQYVIDAIIEGLS